MEGNHGDNLVHSHVGGLFDVVAEPFVASVYICVVVEFVGDEGIDCD